MRTTISTLIRLYLLLFMKECATLRPKLNSTYRKIVSLSCNISVLCILPFYASNIVE